MNGPTDGPTDRPTNGPTDKAILGVGRSVQCTAECGRCSSMQGKGAWHAG